MSIDDYFMVENDKMEKDPDTGKIVKKTVSLRLDVAIRLCEFILRISELYLHKSIAVVSFTNVIMSVVVSAL